MIDVEMFYNPFVFLVCAVIANTITIFNNRKRYLSGCACSYSKEFKGILLILFVSLVYSISVCVIVAMICKNFAVIFFEPPFLQEKINLCLFICLSCAVIFFDKLNLSMNTKLMHYIEKKLHLNDNESSSENKENKSGK